MTRSLLAVAASLPLAVGVGPVKSAGDTALSPHTVAKSDRTNNQTAVLILISDQGTSSSSFVDLLRNPSSPCIMSFSELFVKERRWAFDSSTPNFVSGLWDLQDPAKPTSRYHSGYRNELLESQIPKLFYTKGRGNYTFKLDESKVRKGLKDAYEDIPKPKDFVKFLKNVQKYIASAATERIKTRCQDRFVISLKLFPSFMGGELAPNARTHINSLDEIDVSPAVAELWTNIMKEIGDDPQVSALHLLRDETTRELSNWRRFQPYNQKSKGGEDQRFNCDLKRPMTEFAKLAEQYSGATTIDPADCWKSDRKIMQCFQLAMETAGLPVDEFVDEGFELIHTIGMASKKSGHGREGNCDKGGWLHLKSDSVIKPGKGD